MRCQLDCVTYEMMEFAFEDVAHTGQPTFSWAYNAMENDSYLFVNCNWMRLIAVICDLCDFGMECKRRKLFIKSGVKWTCDSCLIKKCLSSISMYFHWLLWVFCCFVFTKCLPGTSYNSTIARGVVHLFLFFCYSTHILHSLHFYSHLQTHSLCTSI